MATKTERKVVVVSYRADATSLNKTLKTINTSTKSMASAMSTSERRLSKMNTSLEKVDRSAERAANGVQKMNNAAQSMTSRFRTATVVFQGFLASQAVRKIAEFATSMANAGSAVKQFELQMKGLGGTYEEVYEVALELGVPIEQMTKLINNLAPGLNKTGANFQEVVGFAENLTLSLRTFGVEGAQATSIVTQLGQGLSSGQLAGDELKSLRENAAGLGVEFEKAVQGVLNTSLSLKEMGSEGLLTADVVRKGFDEVFENLEDRFEDLPRTWKQSATSFQTAWTNALAVLDEKVGTSEFLKMMTDAATEKLGIFSRLFGDKEEQAEVVSNFEKVSLRVRSLRQAVEDLESQPLNPFLSIQLSQALKDLSTAEAELKKLDKSFQDFHNNRKEEAADPATVIDPPEAAEVNPALQSRLDAIEKIGRTDTAIEGDFWGIDYALAQMSAAIDRGEANIAKDMEKDISKALQTMASSGEAYDLWQVEGLKTRLADLTKDAFSEQNMEGMQTQITTAYENGIITGFEGAKKEIESTPINLDITANVGTSLSWATEEAGGRE